MSVPVDLLCPTTIPDALERAATLAPDVEAVVAADGRLTWAELHARARAHRAALAAAGVRAGDHVGLCLGNGTEWVALFHALAGLGAVVVPVNTRFVADEVAYAVRQSRMRVLVTADRVLSSDFAAILRSVGATAGAAGGFPDLETVLVAGTDVPEGAVDLAAVLAADHPPAPVVARPDDVALIQYTSGTTAFPKGVLLTHRSMCVNAFVSGQRIGVRAGDRMYSARPFFHVAGTTLSILLCAQLQATLVTQERFTADGALELMERERCTHFSGNDTIALMLLNHPDLPRRELALRGAWLAATPGTVARCMDELGAVEAVTGYGMSEASPNVAQSAWWEPRELRVAGRMRPQPGVEVRVVDHLDPDRGVRPAGGTGEIEVRGWNVMRGYFDLPEQTAETVRDGWLRTGDLGVLGDDGRLVFVGRVKETIRVGGENVSPAEVEEVLHTHPAVAQSLVVGLPDPRLVEVPHAIVQLRPGGDTDGAAVLAWLRGRVASFKTPRSIHVVADFESIGMTPSGKIRRSDAAAWLGPRVG